MCIRDSYDSIDEDARGLYRKAMAAFGGIAPSYHIELLDKPTIYWEDVYKRQSGNSSDRPQQPQRSARLHG